MPTWSMEIYQSTWIIPRIYLMPFRGLALSGPPQLMKISIKINRLTSPPKGIEIASRRSTLQDTFGILRTTG